MLAMRKELAEFEDLFSKNTCMYRWIRHQWDRLALFFFRRHVRKLITGSPNWHVLQERVSRGSAVGLDLQRRVEFFKHTLPQCGDGLYVLPGSVIYYPRNVKLGFNVMMNRGVYIVAPAPVTIGDNVLIGPYTVINSGSHHYSDPNKLIRDQGHKLAPIVIEDDVWIGAHATILPGIVLKRGAVVAAGAVVTATVEAFTVVAGVPAKLIRRRETRIF